jgi:5-methylcytosine-specific restriction protein A
MQFVKGNLALRDHLNSGKRIFLFEYVRRAYFRFETELEVFDFDYFNALDSQGYFRQAIRFFFKKPETRLSKAYETFLQQTIASDVGLPYSFPESTKRFGLGKSRIGQDAFRKRIIHRWEYKCAVTGFDKPEVLIASHIHPWRDAKDHERLDVNNGILLSPTYDALSDTNLISFNNNGQIILSDVIETEAYNKIGISGNESINTFNSDNLYYLEKHRYNLR